MTAPYPELYTKTTRVWVKHKTEVWISAVVKNDYDKNTDQLYLSTDEQDELVVAIKSNADLPPLRNPDILIGANDLTSLSYLHEPSVLYNLRVRFLQQNSIYTWCGIVLVAVNPFYDLEIYGEEIIQTYHSNAALSQLDPHIYAVAEDAFTKLEYNNVNQSVIVSGESGAGKTVSAKFAMRYFASIAGSDSNIEARVLASNPIMEAIGNAKTVRNDNSSRFGKYIQILFDRQSKAIMGGKMRTYLLEKSRVTYQSEGERNFHIFYQLCSYAQEKNLADLGLNKSTSFQYLGDNESSPYDDMTRFVEALEILGFSEKQKNTIFQVIAAILHGGNIIFSDKDGESCEIGEESLRSLDKFCTLLDLNVSATIKWLTSRLLKTGTREIITTNLNSKTAQYGLEALLKFIYEKLFSWIVCLINNSLGPIGQLTDYQFIGVLDIYGFEHFEINSFEQFCINYANEVLQQQFNLHVFKLEQEEYVREGIDWKYIQFFDNQPVIDLIESKPIGILCLLDEECRMPRGTDETWCAKLYSQICVNDVFQKPKFGYQRSFIVQHFADSVTYTVEGFLEKNRDTVWEEQIDLLKRSSVVQCLFIDEEGGSEHKIGAGGKVKVASANDARQKKKAKATVGYQFRESLNALMSILNSTEPHYVRCIKPNDNKAAFEFNNVRAVQQLRACGVLETINISSNGFPSRWSYQDFANRYRVLRVGHQERLNELRKQIEEQIENDPHRPKATPRKLVRASSKNAMEIRTVCEDIIKIVYEENVYSHFKLTQENPDAQERERKLYQFGKTKIFFRPGQVALLERIRSQKLRECAILIQKMIRGWLQRRRFLQIRKSALLLQRYGRMFLAKKLCEHLRKTRAATRIQTTWRAYHQRQKYAQIRKAVLGMQTHARGYLARKRFTAIKQNLAAITIQRYWRGYSARKLFRTQRRKVVLIQSCIRRFLAKKKLRALRIEARNVEHVTNLNKGLEKKIIQLQQRIDELYEENRELRLTEGKYNELRDEFVQLEAEIIALKSREKENLLSSKNYRSELEKVTAINLELTRKVEALVAKNTEMEDKIQSILANQKAVHIDPKAIENAVKEREVELLQEFDRERRMLIAEKEREQSSKQALLSKVYDLENTEMSRDNRRRGSISSGTIVSPLKEENGETVENGGDLVHEEISMMMRLSEMECDLKRMETENEKLRKHIARSLDEGEANSAVALITEQYSEMQKELERYKKERADLKRVILIEDRITTFNGDINDAKQQNELIAAYKSLYSKMDAELASKDLRIQKLKTENQQLKLVQNQNPNSLSPNSSLLMAGYNNPDTIDIELNRCYEGMFRFKQNDIPFITQHLFHDLNPRTALSNNCDSHTISYIAYMCIRYLDSIQDEKLIQLFMSQMIKSLRNKASEAFKQRHSLESVLNILACAYKITVLIKYYSEYVKRDCQAPNSIADSGCESTDDKSSDLHPDDEDNLDAAQSLKNFDLTDFAALLKDLIIWIYSKMVKVFEDRIVNLVASAILDNRELSGMQKSKLKNESKEDSSNPPSPTEREIETLLKELSNMQVMFRMQRLDDNLVYQFFKQIFHFMGVISLNNLLIRKDLCNNECAIEVIYNISFFEQFLREHNIHSWENVKRMLDPILQANKLLISNKTEKQIPAIIFTTEALNVPQILKIITMYTPSVEEEVSAKFVKKLSEQLIQDRVSKGENETNIKKAPVIIKPERFPLQLRYIDDSVENPGHNESILHSFGLSCNLKDVEIPILLKQLERYLHKM